jgi:Ca2+-binding EF-hand superfamily protein
MTATYLTRDELMENFWTIMCSAFDRDGNGVLDREEFAELVSVINQKCDPIHSPECLD